MGRAIVVVPTKNGPISKNAFSDLVSAPQPGAKAPEPQEKPDTYRDRLFKYIPAEVVALYLGLTAILGSATGAPSFLNWVIFLAGAAATPYYLRFAQEVRAPKQLIVSTLAFVVWVFALGGPFKDIDGYKQVYGAVLLPIFTFFVAGFQPGQPQPSSAQTGGADHT